MDPSETEISLTHCLLNFAIFFLSSADFFYLFIYFQNQLFLTSFRNTIRASNSLYPDQARRFVGPDLGTNCLKKLSADDISRFLKLKIKTADLVSFNIYFQSVLNNSTGKDRTK